MNVLECTLLVCLCILSTVANAQQLQCGETFTTAEGTLIPPHYPFPISENYVCNWTFQLPPTLPKLVYLSLDEVEIAELDKLTIFDGITTYYYIGANLTGNLIIILNSVASTVRLETGSNATISPRKFMASYRSTAATIFTQEHSGMIKSPLYSNRSTDNMALSWIITKRLSTSIYLSFRSFSIGSGRLSIEDGAETYNFTESTLPNDIATTSANVKVTLEMSLSEPGLNFELFHAQLHPNCSHHIVVEGKTELEVDFKELAVGMDHTVRCFIIVEVKEDVVLSAGVRSLDTTIADSNTIITLNDGGSSHSPNILVYSPSSQLEAPPDVLTSGNRLWIGYNSLAQKRPLNVSVYITVHNSGKHLRDSGSFELPKQSPNATLATNTSMYLLSVASDQQVIATVNSNASLSPDNYILFYDGNSKEKLLTKFTANMTFYPVAATSNQLLIVANNFKGNDTFSASFVSAPKGTNLLSSDKLGSFQLNKVRANSSYTWIIAPLQMNSSAEVILLTINSASLNDESSLRIYNGTSSSSVALYTLTNFTRNVAVQLESAEGVKVVYENKGNASEDAIIDATYQLQPKCEFFLNLTSINGTTITTPNYPSHYPANAQCRWTIVTPSKKVYLTFENMTLPSDQPLLIYSTKGESLKLIANVSGNGIIDDVITDQAPLKLVWSSSLPLGELKVSSGFQIKAFPLDCGGAYNETGQEFSTPSYPKAEKNSTVCIWAITIPSKKGDDVEIIDLGFSKGGSTNSNPELIIHEGGSLQSPSANMTTINETSFLSRTNKLLIRYAYTSDAAGGSSYHFHYSPHSCNKQVCNNGLCLHDSWRCNGINECGDYTDELDCAASPINPPPEPASGISVAAFVVVMFVMLIIGAVLAIFGPIVWRKFRAQSSYQEFRNTADA